MKGLLCLIFSAVVLISSPCAGLTAASFPKTFQDLSFKSRLQVATEGYKPLMDKKAYQELNIVPGEEFYTDRIIAQMEAENKQQETDKKDLSHTEYCEKYQNDTETCPENKKETEQTKKSYNSQPTTPIFLIT